MATLGEDYVLRGAFSDHTNALKRPAFVAA
jgi:hypothetical protein